MRRAMTTARLIGLAAVLTGCSTLSELWPTPQDQGPTKAPLMAEFDRNLATWKAAAITRYAFTYTPSCFCASTAHLIVADGDEIRIDGLPAGARPASGAPVGVDGLFAIVRRAIEGDRVTVDYDPATGVPTAMDSDPIADAVDDELSFKVTDWALDPPDDRTLGEVSAVRERWDRLGLQTYAWSIEIACDCVEDGRQYDIVVKDGDPTVRADGVRIQVDLLEGVPLTVPALLDTAAAMSTVARVRVEFDAGASRPTLVEVHDDRPDAVSSWTYRVTSFSTG